MKVGDEINKFQVEVGPYTSHQYAGASGDFNPIHLDNDFAKKVGLPSLILHGLCTMAFVYRGVMGDKDPSKIKKLKVRFKMPVKPYDKLSVKGSVTGVEGNLAGIDLVMENQNGEQVISNGFAVVEV